GETHWQDLPDPIGMGYDVYTECADSIEKALPSVLSFVEQTEMALPHARWGAAERSSSGGMAHQIDQRAGEEIYSGSLGGGLRKVDPEIFDAIAAEERRQRENIELIASEN